MTNEEFFLTIVIPAAVVYGIIAAISFLILLPVQIHAWNKETEHGYDDIPPPFGTFFTALLWPAWTLGWVLVALGYLLYFVVSAPKKLRRKCPRSGP